MRNLFVLFLLSLATLTVGQNIEKGIYKGYEFPFVICFFTYTDSISEVEYFNKKSGTIFGHKPPKKVVQTGLSSKLYFHSLDDSVRIYRRRRYLMVKNKGYPNVKVRPSESGLSTIYEYRKKFH